MIGLASGYGGAGIIVPGLNPPSYYLLERGFNLLEGTMLLDRLT